MTWWPIKTAPRDGQGILCWDPRASVHVVVAWDAGEWLGDSGRSYAPSHWMTLPTPPSETEPPTLCDAPTHRETPTAKREPAQLVKVIRCDAAPEYNGRVGRLRGTFASQPRFAVTFRDGDWTVCQEIELMPEEL